MARSRRRFVRWIAWAAAALGLAALSLAMVSPIGGWLQSFVFGTGVRWVDAYRALDTVEPDLPGNPREIERLRVAWARVDGEPPAGAPLGARLHRPGMLAHLRYETLDERGERMDEWQVRAVVPSLSHDASPAWHGGCPDGCRHEVARAGGMRLRRSGEPGIASEWVLRMPVGQVFDLGARPLVTHDFLDAEPRRLSLTSVRVGGRSVNRPANIRVTLVEACPARVRVGTLTRLEVYPGATIAIPRGFRYTRWVQLDRCGALSPLPGAVSEPLPVTATGVVAPEPIARGAGALRREAGTGFSTFRVDETWLARHGTPVVLQVDAICRFYDGPASWERLPPPSPPVPVRLEPLPGDEIGKGERLVAELPRDTALFWLRWSEQNEDNRSARGVARREALVTSGPVLCQDLALGPAPAGQVAACVPLAGRAEARFVPKPADACGP
jgi:hypothetical protein